MKLFEILLAMLICISSLANAETKEDEIAKSITEAFKMNVEKVTKSPYGELFEIITPQGIFYTDKTANFVMFNTVVIDTKTKANLTEQRNNQLGEFKFTDLPLKDAIKVVYGKGTYEIVSFEDPRCPYCKKLIPELEKLDITHYVFVVPFLGPESQKKASEILCSAQPEIVWTEWMKNNISKSEPNTKCDSDKLERNSALAKKFRVIGTPTLFFKDGSRLPGFVTAENLQNRLKK